MDQQDVEMATFLGYDDHMMKNRLYGFYEQAVDNFWNPTEIDLSQDIRDWETLTREQKEIILEYTVNFLMGEQRVAEEVAPLVYASHRQGRFDWVAHNSAFLLEEVKHSQFFARWHKEILGTVDPDELIKYVNLEQKTVDKSGRYDDPTWLAVTALPDAMRELLEASINADVKTVEKKFVHAVSIYNIHQEGIAAQPSYRMVLDTLESWDVLPGLKEGYQNILQDEGRHIGGGTHQLRELIEKNPEYEEIVRDVLEGNRESLIGFISYQLANPELDLQKYQDLKGRAYEQRCKEIGIDPNPELIAQITDPEAEFALV